MCEYVYDDLMLFHFNYASGARQSASQLSEETHVPSI